MEIPAQRPAWIGSDVGKDFGLPFNIGSACSNLPARSPIYRAAFNLDSLT
jgi:hypothetical protein